MLAAKTARSQHKSLEAQPVFIRAAVLHLARERLPELQPSDLERVLDLMASCHLGSAVPNSLRQVRFAMLSLCVPHS